MPSSGSCSQCNRPLAAAAVSDLCEICSATGNSPDLTRDSPPPGVPPPQPGRPPVFVGPTGSPGAQSTRSEEDRTRSPMPDGDTDGFALGGDYVPPPPPGYDLIRPLGAGGGGTVYLAREHAAERTVAIKFLHAPDSRTAFDRFLVEARSLALLDHPNIVRVITVGAAGREPFLTMEYAAGGTLADLIGRGCPAPAEAARLMAGAADAVAAAHARNILHRDLKPSNILLAIAESKPEDPGGGPTSSDSARPIPQSAMIPKVSDFGLAKRLDRDEGLTRTGPLGTPCYMSPEAAAGRFREVGPAADVYGLGATLYHLLTGRPPFAGKTQAETIRQVLTDVPVRPRSLRPEVPARLEGVVIRAMERNPAHRYPTAAALADDLRRFLAGEVPAAPVLSPRRRAARWVRHHRARLGLAAAAVLAAAVLVAAGRFWKADPVPPPDPVAVLRADLAAGRPVTLVGPTGLPAYHRLWLGPGTLGDSPHGDGTCAFDGFDVCLLELAPDPGIDRYSVSLELRHLLAKAAPTPLDTDAAAFYFGHAVAPAGDGATAHALFAVGYKDFQYLFETGRPTAPAVVFQWRGFLQSPAGLRKLPVGKGPALPFAARPVLPNQVRSEPGEWRRVVADVTPDEVHVRWWDADKKELVTLARVPAAKMQACTDQTRDFLDKAAPGAGAGLPPWSPRLGFGVLADRSRVAVRNVTVTPLPLP